MLHRYWTLSIITTLFCLFSLGLSAQLSADQLRDKAVEFYETSKYTYAIPLLLDYQKFKPEDIDVKYMIGLSYLAINRPQRAEDYLKYVAADKRAPDDIYIYLGRACQQNHKFKEAIRYYKQHLGDMRMKDPLREAVKDDIKRCVRGIKLGYLDGIADVENIEVLNTYNDEFAPIIPSKNESHLYFSTIRRTNRGGFLNSEGQRDTTYGKPRSDIYFTKSLGKEWQTPQPIEEKYNTRQHDVLHEFSKDGSGMIVSKGNDLSTDSDLYYLAMDPGDEPIVSTKLKSPISSPYWDGNAFCFNDTILLFSSSRKGGYGGRDLYYSMQNTQTGRWSAPRNLGGQINTEYDEDCPFLANNGRTLYFSSNNLESMGGYDVFSAVFQDSSRTWTKPTNIGLPINSAGDDRHFRLANNGLRAFFSSKRPGGFGGHDLYLALFRRYITEQIEYSDPLVFFMVEPPEPVVAVQQTEVTEMSELPIETNPTIEQPVTEPVVQQPIAEQPVIQPEPVEIKTFQFSPINYEPEKDIIQSATRSTLDKLAALLNQYPQLNLTLHAHTDDNGPYINNLYYGIKRSNAISNYLVEQGVDQGSITIQSSGQNYPRAKNKNGDGKPNLLGQRFNNRIDLLVSNTLGTPVRVELIDAVISPVIQNKEYDNYRNRVKGVTYKVQVLASPQEQFDDVLSNFPDAMVENSKAFNLNKISVGLHDKFVSANALKQKLQASGYSEAFVVPYLGGVRLSRSYAEYYQEEFPDLKIYLVGQ